MPRSAPALAAVNVSHSLALALAVTLAPAAWAQDEAEGEATAAGETAAPEPSAAGADAGDEPEANPEGPAADAAQPPQSEGESAAQDAEAPAPDAGASPPVATVPRAAEPTPTLNVRPTREQTLFGQYRIRLSLSKPRFDDGLEFYDELYGKEKLYPTIAADWFAWDWYATLGLSLRLGYYTADGYTAKQVSGKAIKDIKASDIERDKNGPTTLTLIPIQAALTAEFTPFNGKWLVVDGWIGLERLYWQEVRTGGSSDSKASALLVADDKDDKDDALTNKGWKTATTIGASANILLNGFDQQSAASMRGSLGLGYVYLSPFIEFVRTLDKKGASFGRSVFGIGFTFESMR